MKYIVLLVCVFYAAAVQSNRSKDYQRQYHLKWTQLEKAKPIDEDKSGVVPLFRGRSHRRGHSKQQLSASYVRESFEDWVKFKRHYNKSYDDLAEQRERFLIFAQNKRTIESHNAEFDSGHKTFKLRINHLADLRPEEYSHMNGFQRNYNQSLARGHEAVHLAPMHVALPDQIDWRQHGMVTAVKNQGHCGSCWSFSSTGALEGQHKRKTGKLVSLSEQNLVDCSTAYGNHGCNGGLMDQAFQYIKDNDGIDTERSYPYEAMDDRCRFKRSNVGADDAGFMDVQSGSEEMLKNAVGTVGPVSVAIDASHQSFQFYNGGVYIEPQCSPEALDHGVLVVGYGTTQEGVDYWIVKNSWGPTWGENGYIRMARNRNNQCGIATQASYPLV